MVEKDYIFVEQTTSLCSQCLKKVDAKIHYPIPLHLQEAADDLGYKEGSFPITESQAKKVMTLPVHQFLNEDQLKYMVNCMKDFYL